MCYQSTVSSPCIRRCCLDDDDICLGCFRTMAEIMEWNTADDERKRAILRQAGQRSSARKHRGG